MGAEDEAAAEVELALGCAEGKAAAHEAFERRYLGAVADALAPMKLSAATVDEVRQMVREKLLVGDPPAIVAYAGRGTLHGLVKVVAVRTAVSLLRKTRRETSADLGELPAPAHDPELAFLKEHYREAFRAAFEAATKTLDGRARNLLRLHHVGGMTLEELACMYGVHRATIVRSLAAARRDLLVGTRRGLEERLQADRDEVESILALIQSRFEVSVARMLASTSDGHAR
jgi:RNA polymerase sigma-70 factor (ECF subfamily)